jgi:hypothetical protein
MTGLSLGIPTSLCPEAVSPYLQGNPLIWPRENFLYKYQGGGSFLAQPEPHQGQSLLPGRKRVGAGRARRHGALSLNPSVVVTRLSRAPTQFHGLAVKSCVKSAVNFTRSPSTAPSMAKGSDLRSSDAPAPPVLGAAELSSK